MDPSACVDAYLHSFFGSEDGPPSQDALQGAERDCKLFGALLDHVRPRSENAPIDLQDREELEMLFEDFGRCRNARFGPMYAFTYSDIHEEDAEYMKNIVMALFGPLRLMGQGELLPICKHHLVWHSWDDPWVWWV